MTRSQGRIPGIVSVVTRPKGIDYLRRAVRRQVATEGLRPLSLRTGIPLGQLRSVIQGRAARSTTLKLMASRVEPSSGTGLPSAVAEALDLPRDASMTDALRAIDKDALTARLREGIGLVQELMDRTATAVAPISGRGPDAHSPERVPHDDAVAMIPFAPGVRLAAGTGEVVSDESSEVSIAVAVEALASWAQPERLTCVRAVGDSMEPAIRDGNLVAVDSGRTDPLDGKLFAVRTGAGLVVKRLRRQPGGRWLLTSDNPAHAYPVRWPKTTVSSDRWLGADHRTGVMADRGGTRRQNPRPPPPRPDSARRDRSPGHRLAL